MPPSVWGLSQNSAGLAARFITECRTSKSGGAYRHQAARPAATCRPPASAGSTSTPGARPLALAGRRPARAAATNTEAGRTSPKAGANTCSICRSTTASHPVEIGVPEGRRARQGEPRTGGPAEADRLLRHVDHPGRLRLAARHGPHRDPRPAPRPAGHQPRLLRQRQDGAGVGEFLAEIDAAVYVIDCLPNMEPAEVAPEVPPARQAAAAPRIRRRPSSSSKTAATPTLDHRRRARNSTPKPRRAARKLRSAEERRRRPSSTTSPATHLIGDDAEGSTDGSHPNDLGFMRQADVFMKAMRPILP